MDLQQLEADLIELQRRYLEWNTPISRMKEETWKLRHQGSYTEADQVRDMQAIYRQQLALYDPDQAEYPVREALLAAYISGSNDERAAIRIMVAKLWRAPYMLFDYI